VFAASLHPAASGAHTMLRTAWTACAALGGTFLAGFIGVVMGLPRPFPRVGNLIFHVWGWWVLKVSGVRLRVSGREHLPGDVPAFFFVGNHQSALDIPILAFALRGRLRFLAKKSLFRIPVFGWYLHMYGFTAVDRANARAARAAVQRMLEKLRHRPISYVVFPEGTRSVDGRLLPFRRGALKICQRAGLPLAPFAIDGSVRVLRRGSFRVTPGEVRLTFAPPIPAAEVVTAEQDELLARVRRDIATALGQPEAGGPGPADLGD